MARVAPLLLADYARVCASRNLARDMIEMRLMIRSFLFGAFIVLSGLATAAALADEFPKSDAAKIADALRAGPDFITKDATVLDWPSSPGGAYRVLREGTNEWSCLPGVPLYPHVEPGCFDATFFDWLKQSLAGRQPNINRVGVS